MRFHCPAERFSRDDNLITFSKRFELHYTWLPRRRKGAKCVSLSTRRRNNNASVIICFTLLRGAARRKLLLYRSNGNFAENENDFRAMIFYRNVKRTPRSVF